MKKMNFLANKQNKYSIRKFTVGTTSILIGSLMFLGSEENVRAAEVSTETVTTETPTTEEVTTETVTTEAPTTEEVTTESVTTEAPTTEEVTTESVTTEAPTTEKATTETVTTEAPTTEEVTTETVTTEAPTTEKATTETVTTEAPTTEKVTTETVTTEAPTTEKVTTESVTTEAPTTEAPTTEENPVIININSTTEAVNSAETLEEKTQVLTSSLEEAGVSQTVTAETVANLTLENKDLTREEIFAAILNAIATSQQSNTPVATPVVLTTNTSMMESITLGSMEAVNTLASSSTNNLVSVNTSSFTDAGYGSPIVEANDNVIKPHNAEPIDYQANFSIDNAAKSGDTFNITYSNNIIPSDLDPEKYKAEPILDPTGEVIATGTYDALAKTITYTFTDYVDKYENVNANISLSGYIDKSVVQNNSSQVLSIDLDGETSTYTGNIEYGQPISSPSSNIESIYTHLDEVNHTVEQIFYINPLNQDARNATVKIYGAQKDANGNIVQEGSPYIDQNTKIDIYSVGSEGVLPESMYINDFSQYTNINSAFSSQYVTYSNDEVALKFGNINSAFIIRVVSQYDPSSNLPILQGASMISESPTDNMIYTVETSNRVERVEQSNSGEPATPTYKIGDYVWEDTNKDGVQDGTENGIENVLVTLQFSDGTQKSVRTDSSGHYEFAGLTDGKTYTVTFEAPTGYTPTNTTDGVDEPTGSNPNTNTITINGEDNLTIDKGYISNVVSPQPEPTYSLGNFTWFDMNDNGIQDDYSPDDLNGDGQLNDVTPYEGVTVRIYDAVTNLPVKNEFGEDMVVISDANGHYQFDGLKNGDYVVEFEIPEVPGMIIGQDAHDVGVNDEVDSDGVRVGTSNIFRTTATINNADNMSVDMAVTPASYNVGDRIWNDLNKDGVQSTGETNFTGPVTVKLVDANNNPATYFDGTPIPSIVTTDGTYLFTGVMPGDYKVIFELPPNTPVTSANTGDDALDSDGVNVDATTPNVFEAPVTVVDADVLTVDLGVVTPVYKIGDRVWEDNNNNDIQDAGDTGIAGVTVTLKDASGNVIATQVTDANGNYLFEGLTNGDYTVEFGTPADSAFVPVNDNVGTSDMDSDPSTVAVTIDNEDDLTIDRGFEKLLTIGDKVFEDQNHDGIQDPTEPGIAGVTVTLTKPDGTTVTTTTDSNGGYTFTDLPKGTYTVTFDTPPNYVPVQENQGTDDTKDSDPVFNSTKTQGSVTVDLTDNNPTIDAGFEKAVYKIGDRVWEDNNNNDIQDAGDTGIAGVTVTLKDASGNVIATQVTDANGNYLFEGLTNGDYTVEFGTPADSAFVPVKDNVGTSDVDSDPSTVAVTIDNADDLTIDRGFEKLLTIGDKVFEDQNHDGIQDPTEPGIPGVTVTLTKPDGTTVTTTTDSNGGYTFTDLPKGTYTVTFDTPPNYVPVQENQGTDGTKDSDPVFNSTKTQGSVTVDLTDNNPTIDAGFEKAVYKIGDRVWEDNNNNDIQDAGDTGIAGVTVTLKDASGNVIATQVTDANGNYLFEGLTNGDYTVEFGTPADSAFVPVNDNVGTSDMDSDPSTVAVTIDNEDDLTIDRGFEKLLTIGDKVFEDQNHDGIQDPTEPGIAGVTVTLTKPDGTTVTTTTDSNGGYTFTDLPKGTYTVTFDTPPNYVPVQENQGTDDTKDSDPVFNSTKTQGSVTVDLTDNNPTIDAGFEKAVYKIGDRVWEDNNNNDIQDAGDTGIAGVTVTLKDASGNVIATQVTDANGNYLFEGLTNGDYTLEFGIPADSAFVPVNDNVGTSDMDSDPSTVAVTIDNADDLTIDRGFEKLLTIGDKVFEDQNHDGVQDPTEPGIAGVTVTLTKPDGTTVTTTTDSNGGYTFTDLPKGTYTVTFDTPPNYVPVQENQGTDDTKDSDPVFNSTKTQGSVTVDLTDNNPTIDAGFEKAVYKIGDRVWEDNNNNDIQDAGDTGIAGVTVTLKDASGNVIATQVTDANGNYLFEGLTNGDYTVEFGTPADSAFVPVKDNVGTSDVDSDPSTVAVTIDNADDLTIDRGFEKVTPPVTPVYKIGDRVWEDNNNNDIQDAGDTGIAGVTVTLKDASGNVIATQVTDANGNYLFEGLTNGDYTVEFGTPADSTLVPVKDNVGTTDVDSDSSTVAVTINNADDLTIDRGFEKVTPPVTPVYKIGDRVWEDNNNNDIQDAGDTGIAGVIVTLKDASGKVIATQVTDANGNYLFEGLTNGDYTVEFGTPADSTLVPVKDNVGTSDVDSDKAVVAVTINNADDLTIDRGFEKVTPPVTPVYKIGDRIWQDNNNNDIQDAGDTGIAGVTVTLKDASGKVIATQVTDANGNYLFEGLPNGDYTVEFGTPADSAFVPVKDNVGTSDVDSDKAVVAVTINNADDLTIDRGFEKPEITPEPKPEPQPEPKPEPQPEPKPEPQPEPKPEPKPEPQPEPKPEPQPEPQPEPKPEPQPEPKSEVQPELQQKPDTQVSKRDGIKHAHPTDSHHGKYDNAGKAHEVKELPDTGESNNNGLNAALALAVGGFTLMLTRRKREE
ncbi:carboxypeptidase regulatory-like domain-containing protein [Macrococcoides canis]|uniref:SdrD B-like domain-containing protein n=1 Tax=Macrococcoides canis TaxID=1855823 RepID=UPI001AEC088D|nr:SdrD B-like domain-containing protein [Macrococcus canis]QTQ07931.1 carboxypeptidase regulatory-like domain-containing protein [Macrococcus canis]